MDTKNLKFSICMPVYNGENFIRETLCSILNQNYSNFELIITDDCSTDNTVNVVKTFNDPRIHVLQNDHNLGYPKNLEKCRKNAAGDIIYLMGQDDILAATALLDTYHAFEISDDIGAVTRPYYWFDSDISLPVRIKDQLNPEKDEIVKITDDYSKIICVFKTLDQLSGLAFRKKYMNIAFHEDIFPCHIYPFASILKNHPVIFLKDYNVAVRIRSSQCRNISSIYNKSPLQSWVDMFLNVYCENKFKRMRDYCIKNFVAVNYIGLVQIKNYAPYKFLFREIFLLIKYRWQNIFNVYFWFFCLGTIFMPPRILIPMVDWYKNKINSKFIKIIKFHSCPN